MTATGPLVAQMPNKAATALISYDTQFHPTYAQKGMVVSKEKFASEAGLSMLKAGGNAVDAAVATGFALAVTHPQAGNIGGGGFMMVYLKDTDKSIAIDYREMAPAAAHRDLFLGADGNVDNALARFSYKSSGVPGSVMGLVQALENYGTMSLADVMAPAIKLAEEGFHINRALSESLVRYSGRLQQDAVSKELFFKTGGKPYAPGELLQQPLLAETLKTIAAKGADGFYKGAVADMIVAAMNQNGGLVTLEDLANYKVVERMPVEGTFMGHKIVSMPPPSSGGVHLVQMLNVLEGYDLKNLGHNSAAYVHRVTETMKYAYSDRSKYLGDPDFTKVPVAALTSKSYAKAIWAKINLEKATPSTEIGPDPKLLRESHDTTHYSVMDKWGNMVANTYTLNFTFGNGKSVAGAGFLLNNEMDDFSAKPGVPNAFGLLGGEANSIQPGKRPLSSMTPTFVFKDGKPYITIGSPGGSLIITSVLQVVLNAIAHDMNISAAVNMPRFHHQWFPDSIFMEPGFSTDTRRLLAKMGQNVDVGAVLKRKRVLGSVHSIMKLPQGIITGTVDPRRPGAHVAAY
ncbi:MAG: gamma-glutamyltransferase [Kordiimonadaceae bacterium]|nr:gamma-glutamyltransferase [Kordiimonadaceae bacterium]